MDVMKEYGKGKQLYVDKDEVERLFRENKEKNKEKIFNMFYGYLVYRSRSSQYKLRGRSIEYGEIFNCYYIAFDRLYNMYDPSKRKTNDKIYFFGYIYAYLDKQFTHIVADYLFDMKLSTNMKMMMLNNKKSLNKEDEEMKNNYQEVINFSYINMEGEDQDYVDNIPSHYIEKAEDWDFYNYLNETLDIVVDKLQTNDRAKMFLKKYFRIEKMGNNSSVEIAKELNMTRALTSMYNVKFNKTIKKLMLKMLKQNDIM